MAFERRGDQLKITLGGEPLATYVVRDETILRPYFAHPCPGRHPGDAPVPAGRRGPTRPTTPTMHPGLWLAFGDINGVDFWRNKGRVEHDGSSAAPEGGAGTGTFTVRNRYVAAAGRRRSASRPAASAILARPRPRS